MAKFVPRERKHKRIARQTGQRTALESDANAETILPTSKSEKEHRRRILHDELRAQRGNENVSSKKRKRLDKYIDSKLKKEENLELLKKLAAQKVDTSLFQSSKKLGRANESKRERFQRALKERQAGIDVAGDQTSILFEPRREASDVSDGSDEEASQPGDAPQDHGSLLGLSVTSSAGAFGSGLKRPLDTDEHGLPQIKRRKRRKQTATKHVVRDLELSAVGGEQEDTEATRSDISDKSGHSEEEWHGFNSDTDLSLPAHESESDDTASSRSSHSEDSRDDPNDQPARVSAFKAWADVQRNKAVGFTPSLAPTNDSSVRAKFKPRPVSPDPVTQANLTALQAQASHEVYRPAKAITVIRKEEVESARLELPVVQEEQRIIEAVNGNSVTVICGATGSGKTTQVPQMLLENGYATTGLIGVTQPRRVAATSVAARVASELGSDFGKQVAHQVRYDSTVSRETTIKFMTDGVLLREIGEDFALNKYSAIVVDEAHERSVNTDILIGMLSRIVPLRLELSREKPDEYKPLKLIIMSASLRVTDFILNDRLFRKVKPPIVEAEGRQYPVTVHFARRTQRDYVAETVRKVSRGHQKLPPGGMLVFLTGQDEIQTVARRLKELLSQSSLGLQSSRTKARSADNEHHRDYLEDDNNSDSTSDAEIKIHDENSEDDDEEFMIEDELARNISKGPLKPYILPLYAALPSNQQMRIFEPPPEGSRQIVLSTNVAETSLTIPGIRYVFDCGRSKEKRYDDLTGVQEFAVDWISKASALQRSGRAGRTGPGHCYRLYSSAIYEQDFEEHTSPEILRTPIEATVLQLKSMKVENVINFPFPTAPRSEQLALAERLLKTLGAIESSSGKILDLGRELIKYPVNPRYGKMLSVGARNGVLAHTIALVAGLAVGDLFVAEPQMLQRPTNENLGDDGGESSGSEPRPSQPSVNVSDDVQKQRQAYGRASKELSSQDDHADVIKLLTAVAAHAQAEVDREAAAFCSRYFLREKGMSEVQQLRRQLHNIVQDQQKDPYTSLLRLATAQELKMLKQVVAAGFIDHVAIRADLLPSAGGGEAGRKPKRAIEVPYRTLIPSNHDVDRTDSAESIERQKSVYVHSGSLLARLSVKEMPSYIIYSHLSRAAPSAVHLSQKTRTRMHPLTTVGPKQLATLAEGTPLLDIGKPIGKIEETAPGKRECWVGIALRDPTATGPTPWPLGAWKVSQIRTKKDWVIERIIAR